MDPFYCLEFLLHITAQTEQVIQFDGPASVKLNTKSPQLMKEAKDIDVDVQTNALSGKKVLVGLTGGIAVVDSVRILREIRRHGATPIVIMTHSAQEIISPLAIEWASQTEIITDWGSNMGQLEEVSSILVCPATRHTIASFIHGIMDTPLQMALSAARGRGIPMLFVPSMHGSLSSDPVTKELCTELEGNSISVLWGETSEGRKKQPQVERVVSELCHITNKPSPNRQNIMLTVGATRSQIDDIRYIQNTSTGETGYCIGEYLYRLGHEISFCEGFTTATRPIIGADFHSYSDPSEMLNFLVNEAEKGKYTVWIHVAAVLDYLCNQKQEMKVKSGMPDWEITFNSGPKHIERLSKFTDGTFRIGFKLESNLSHEELVTSALESLSTYKLDGVVANHLKNVGEGVNRAVWVDKTGSQIPLDSNDDMAKVINNQISRPLND